jgi:hypothetical protein
MSNRRDGVTITWNYKQYYFDGLFGKYLGLCTAGFVSGGMIGAAVGSAIGLSVAIASPVIVGVAAIKIAKHIKLK